MCVFVCRAHVAHHQVDHIMGHDVMKSVKNLVIDLLDYKPVLIYLVRRGL